MSAPIRRETEVAVRRLFAELIAANGLPAVNLPDVAVNLLAGFGLR